MTVRGVPPGPEQPMWVRLGWWTALVVFALVLLEMLFRNGPSRTSVIAMVAVNIFNIWYGYRLKRNT
jgi:hypothetical protein